MIMRKNKFIKALVLATIIGFVLPVANSCSTAGSVQHGKKLAYTIANHYFVRNDVSQYGTMTINTQADFDKVFGAAAVMGKGGLPTQIDFSKQTVLAVTMPPSGYEVELSPESLSSDGNGMTTFRYRAIKGAEHKSYTSCACLIVVTNKLNEGTVKFQYAR